ncbi:general substrate transporter [Aspergillus alliaceus]|uniref:general substrate transporter n=1 Tax=Petromyces alliaceus TaxID=209559 RepID=UPI0012A49289|nr:general substrate transporter [Aspergillus alliaceus]KAB8234443.1 general substrate transporter [Aspergillus alliaceus]
MKQLALLQTLTAKLLCAVFSFGLMGMARGLDEGLISTTVAQPSFIQEFHLQDPGLSASEQANRLSNITSMVHIGSFPGALFAFLLCEHIGLLWTMRQLCVVWIAGVVIFITAAGNISQVYAGRFIMGLGIGQAGVAVPIYLSEVAKPSLRGLLVCTFATSEYLGIMVGYFSSWGTTIHIPNTSSKQWIIPQSIQIMVAGILLFASFACEESPRHLCKVGRFADSTRSLSRLWNLPTDDPRIQKEIECIRSQMGGDPAETNLQRWCKALKQLATDKSNISRLVFLLITQLLSQWSGSNAITTYTPELFALLGVTGQSQKLLRTAILGAIKFAASLICTVFLIDYAGRKRPLITGILIQFLAMLYIAIYLTVTSPSTRAIHSKTEHDAGMVAIVCLYLTGVGWALGWNSIQYLINAEIFPLSVRTVGSSVLMCFHYANRYGLSKATPSMLLEHSLRPEGTFWFFAALALLGLFWVWVRLPETARRNLEEANTLVS